MKYTLYILLLCLFPVSTLAQGYSSGSKKAIKQFEEALGYYRNSDFEASEQSLLKAVRTDDQFIEAYHLLSQICFDSRRIEEAITHYSRSLEIDPEGNPDGYRLLAGLYFQVGEYARCREAAEKFLSYPPGQVRSREAGEKLVESCRFAIRAMENPVPFHPVNLGDSVNSIHSEYWPSLSVDEELLMFTVLLPVTRQEGVDPSHFQEDFYFTRRSGEGWGGRKNAGPPLNTPDNEGAQTMTADGKILYFTACNRRDGQGQCDLYSSVLENGKWSTPRNLGTPVNSRYSEKHPTISADGRLLIFTSNRPGGKGSYDIWMSVRSGDTWSPPVNLGDSVNTSGMEQSPFLHPDQRSLYFSSTGWPGMGQGDLFFTRLDEAWPRPVNLGYPINTHNDDIGLTVNARGNRAYYASDRERGTDTDIYTFELPEEVKPVLVSFLNGRVYDSRNMRGVASVIQLIDLETGEVVVETPSARGEGDYLVPLPTDRDYALNVSAEGYLFYSAHFSFTGTHSRKEPFRRDIPLDRIIVGSSVVLNNIFFETDSHALLSESMAELEKVATFLEGNPGLAIEIGGHTDNTGESGYNQELSERRAASVVEYLEGKGIPSTRMKSVGYGDRSPVGDNGTEEGRALNRRTEMKIAEIKQ